jgi:alkyldihydroxyacetonephosphate synthase
MRALAQADSLPTVVRLADELETALNASLASTDSGRSVTTGSGTSASTGSGPSASTDHDLPPGGAVAVTIYEGTVGEVRDRHLAARAILEAAGGTSLGAEPALVWQKSRFHGPYLRDALLRAGAFAETVETASSWSALPELYAQTSRALSAPTDNSTTPSPTIVTCHISHLYPTGAALYFTVLAAPGKDVLNWWRARKEAACAAIIGNAGTITHHHAVGTEHRAWMADEIGDLGLGILRAVKARLDPVGILNPGKLTPGQ